MRRVEMGNQFGEKFAAVEKDISSRLSPRRRQHTIGVATTAAGLARRWGADPEKAYLAGLLHDVAREFSGSRLLKAAVDFGIVLTAFEQETTALLHAPVGAALARHEFHVTDPEVLAAIRYHTTGRAGMSLLEKIVFLADYIEPGRSYPGVDSVRQAVERSLDEAVSMAMTQILVYLLNQGKCISPEMVEARNELVRNQQ